MILGMLNLGPKNLVGLDIGVNSIKVCELSYNPKKRDDFKLVKFAQIALPDACLIEDEIQKPDELVETIEACLQEAGIKNVNAAISLSGPNTMSKRLQLPGGSTDDLEDQVMWESEQFIPFGIDESTVSFHVIGENAGGGTDVLIAAARNDVVHNFKGLAQKAGLKVKVVDLDMFSLINVFKYTLGDNLKDTKESFIIIDFGAQKTDVVVYKNDAVVFTREMNIGGGMITEEIMRQMGIPYEEAEGLKIRGDDQGNLPEEIVEIIDSVLESFFSEVKKTLNFYMTASGDEEIEYCFVTGGSSLIPGFVEGMESVLGIEVQFLNPFEKISYDEKKFSEEDIGQIASTGLIAVGLAMRSPY